MIMNRWRDWLIVPIAAVAMVLYPLWWLIALPHDLRFAYLTRGWSRDVDIDLDGLVAVRWFTRDIPSMASGIETDSYFELTFTDSRRAVILDGDAARLEHRLAARGKLPARSRSLGQAQSGLAVVAWFWSAVFWVTLWLLARVAC